MKRGLLFFKYLSLVAASAFTVLTCSCSCQACVKPTLDEVMPKEFGESEGLWLYKDNERMRTDGNEVEALLKEITVDGQTYFYGENLTVWRMGYATAAREIFYVLEVEHEDCKFRQYVWHYNYETKEDGYLYTLPDDTNYYLEISDDYVYVHGDDGCGILFDTEGRLVDDDLGGLYLSGDILYRIFDYDFKYWKSGQLHSLTLPYKVVYVSASAHCGDYFYVAYNDGIGVVNLLNGEIETVNSGSFSSQRSVIIDSVWYFLTDVNTGAVKFWAADGSGVRLVYTFTDKKSDEIRVWIDDYNSELITLRKEGGFSSNFHYVIADDVMKSGDKTVTNDIVYTYVGAYKFYIEERRYGNGETWVYTGCLYCLMRERDGIIEAMQYNLDGAKFFDDIREY